MRPAFCHSVCGGSGRSPLFLQFLPHQIRQGEAVYIFVHGRIQARPEVQGRADAAPLAGVLLRLQAGHRGQILPRVYSSGAFVRRYPPRAPRPLRRNPAFPSRPAICSRYFMEMPCRAATSFKETNSSPPWTATSIIRRRAYRPLVEIFTKPPPFLSHLFCHRRFRNARDRLDFPRPISTGN